MKIILNSDILFNTFLIKNNLSKNFQELFSICQKKGHVIIIPLTTLLEFNRAQLESLNKKTLKLEKAYMLLEDLNIKFTRVEPPEVIKKPDLIELVKKSGVEVKVENPTNDDYLEAHKRACLHECPHAPEKKSDEMRDLIIWMIALRYAQQDGNAILISRDEVHVNPRGDNEANSVGLIRFKSEEEVLEYFEVETQAGKLIKQLIMPIWEDLLKAGLPLNQDVSIVGVAQPRFIQGTEGISNAYCLIRLRTLDGKMLKTNIAMKIDNNVIVELELSEIMIDENPWDKKELALIPNKAISHEEDDYKERIDSLKELIGE